MKLEINGQPATPIDVRRRGDSQVRIVLHIPLAAIAAAERAAGRNRLVLDLLDVGPKTAEFLVSTIPQQLDLPQGDR